MKSRRDRLSALLDSYLVGKALASQVAGKFRGTDAAWAVFDATYRHRYALARVWGELGADLGVDACMFLLLNPSTADERILDRTLARCRDYALRWGYGGMLVANVCSFRSTSPTALRRPETWEKAAENARAIDVLAGMSETIVCGWGACPSVTQARVPDLVAHADKLKALQVNTNGSPSHPLYLLGGLTPKPYPVPRRHG